MQNMIEIFEAEAGIGNELGVIEALIFKLAFPSHLYSLEFSVKNHNHMQFVCLWFPSKILFYAHKLCRHSGSSPIENRTLLPL